MLGEGLGDQAFGERGLLLVGNHPADDVATEDVEDDVEIEIGPFRGTEQLGDIPAPDFVGTGREEFGLGIGGMDELITALVRLALVCQETIEGAFGSEIDPLIEEGGVDLGGRAILKTRGVKHGENRLAFVSHPKLVATREGAPFPRAA